MTLQAIPLRFDQGRVFLQVAPLRSNRSECGFVELRRDGGRINPAIGCTLANASLFHRGYAGCGPFDSAFTVGDAARTTCEDQCNQGNGEAAHF